MSDEFRYEHRVRLALDDGFSDGMRRAADAAGSLRRSLAWLDATWEPHDWSEFD
jgi:hypothetical protein